jgi:MinD superfamily P-loop ATPase
MQEIVVLSGKGGTGKTSITGSLAALAKSKVLADGDVDAADLHLLMQPSIRETYEFRGGQTAVINDDKCTQCGLCQQVCRFNAIADYKIKSVSCEGCGFCANACPEQAITMQERLAGHYYVSDTTYGTLVHARMGIAQENSGKLVATVRQKARELAESQGVELIICDGPPGTGCPVISCLSGASLALLVTEPTLSGMHDLERVMEVCRHFSVPAAVAINKFDINEENSKQIENYCREQGAEVLAKIPYDNTVTEAMVHGKPVTSFGDGKASKEIKLLWQKVEKRLKNNQGRA